MGIRTQTAPLQLFERTELARIRFAPMAYDVPSPESRNATYTVTFVVHGTFRRPSV